MKETGCCDVSDVLSPITLPCGRVILNRLVKASTYEHLSPLLGSSPSWEHFALYRKWGQEKWGMVMTGNVQVSPEHLTLGCDLIIPNRVTDDVINRYSLLAAFMKGLTPELPKDVTLSLRSYVERVGARSDDGPSVTPLAIMQISHAGRQSMNLVGGRRPLQLPLAPSASRVGEDALKKETSFINRLFYRVLFQQARGMNLEEVQETVDAYVRAVKTAHLSGFDGVQLHGAHGYLISQFISRKTNHRSDEYGNPLAFLRAIIFTVRKSVPDNFIVGLKLNAGDYSSDGFTEEDAKAHLVEIMSWDRIDYIEISGGNYEAPEFTRIASARQVFFESFSKSAMQVVEERIAANRSEGGSKRPPPLIMLTGGLRTRAQFVRALRQRHAHILGIGRGATLRPTLPRELYSCASHDGGDKNVSGIKHAKCDWSWEVLPDPEPKSPIWWPRVVGAAIGVSWYNLTMRRQAEGCDNAPSSASPAGVQPYLYSPDTHWLTILLDMYVEPLAEFIYSKLPFVSFFTPSSSSRSDWKYIPGPIPVYISMLFSLCTNPLVVDYVFFYPRISLLNGKWYIQVGWVGAFFFSVFSLLFEYVVLRKRLRLSRSVQ